MKNRLFKLLLALVVIIVLISSCNGPRNTEGARHGRGVNNSHYRGY
jgi:hypothetical protein